MTTVKFSDIAAQWTVIKKDCLPKIEDFLESGNYIGNSIIEEFGEVISFEALKSSSIVIIHIHVLHTLQNRKY